MSPNFHARFAAYFSMEIALDPAMPTYSGGLGILAGDTLRSAADANVPLVGITLLHRKGYFEQHLDSAGNQTESPSIWAPESVLKEMQPRATVRIEGRNVRIRAWEHVIIGVDGYTVPVYLLDTALAENTPFDQTITDHLYGGDDHYRLCQEVVLGMGGVEMLRELGYHHIQTFHMNEGHSALLTLAILQLHMAGRPVAEATADDIAFLRKKCVFTTHTPVPAGHDKFSKELVRSVMGEDRLAELEKLGCLHENVLNMTYLGLRGSHYVNGVAMQHGEISRTMFPEYPVHAITNGVHAVTWTSPSFQQLYDKHIPEWRHDKLYLRYAIGIPLREIDDAHRQAKQALLDAVKEKTGAALDPSVMTIGFARRAATYKRADLVFTDPDRLKWIAQNAGSLQIVFAGKAHPNDGPAKDMIRHVFQMIGVLKDAVRIVYLENYEMVWAQLLTSGTDLWLNTPHRPYEASGTSGMKAALNGVPSFSVPDGWWIEGHIEGATGWDIGHEEIPDVAAEEIGSLYDKLENVILPTFYGRRNVYLEIMRHCIALNGSFFNTQRMLAQYVANAYSLGRRQETAK
ncbi:MAG TPA: alpha-glucan family phosphorylase [Candidatus Acidoferrum sp.]|nr:alpha-glucan family phosphorylase [Candidatus Acidoferrum sp.]